MKNLLLAATAAAAAVAMAPAAQATVMDPITLSTVVTNDAFSADNVISPEAFSFNLPAGLWSATVSATAANTVSWKFTDILLDGVSVLDFLLPTGKYITGSFTAGGAGHTLTFIGTGGGSFGGSIAIAPIPEPATWAMMLVGVAAIGTAMRRRNQNVRVSFS